MLKGKAIIELTDVNTGEKTTQVEHNIMTNALAEFFNPPMAHFGIKSLITTQSSSSPSYAPKDYMFAYDQPDLSWATSGIVVSNKAQEESPDNLEIPRSSIIGAAAKQYKTQIDDGMYGTYNEAESFIDREHKLFNHVFDFPTSACNGKVCCLSIMHPGGVIGLPYAQYDSFKENLDKVYRLKYFVGGEFDYDYSSADSSKFKHPIPGFDIDWLSTAEGTKIGGTWTYNTKDLATMHSESTLNKLLTCEKVLAFDVINNYMYTMTWTGKDKFVVRCRESRLSSINAITGFKLIKEYPEIVVTSYKSDTAVHGIACVDKMTQKFYYITNYTAASSTVEPNKEMYVYEVDLVEGTTRTYTMGNSTGASLHLTTISHHTYSGSSNYGYSKNSAIVHNGCLYATSIASVTGKYAVEKYRWYKIPMDNPSNVTECKPVAGFVPINAANTLPREIQLIDDRYLGICDGTTRLLLNVEDDTIYNDYATNSTIGTYHDGGAESIPIVGSKFVMYTYSYFYTYYSAAVLGVSTATRLDIPMTINNLSTPIHKTASQTMKITYVLKEVEPEDEEGGETE
jgi:hypothetical protein